MPHRSPESPHLEMASLEEAPTWGPRLHSALAETHSDPGVAPKNHPRIGAAPPGSRVTPTWRHGVRFCHPKTKKKGEHKLRHKRNKRGNPFDFIFVKLFFVNFEVVRVFLRRHCAKPCSGWSFLYDEDGLQTCKASYRTSVFCGEDTTIRSPCREWILCKWPGDRWRDTPPYRRPACEHVRLARPAWRIRRQLGADATSSCL